MNPLLIMALLSAASAGANYQGQKKVDKGRANAMRESERRRTEAERRSAASAQDTTQLLTNAGRNQDAKAAEIEARYNSHTPAPGPTSRGVGGFAAPPRSTLTVASDQRAMDTVNAAAAAEAKAKAGLNAYGDAMVGAQIGANRNATDIEQQNTGVRNWQQYVMPAQMEAANASGQDWGTLADALQVAATIYGPIGLSKNVAAEAAAKAGEAGKAAYLAAPHDMFDPSSWQTWLKPQAAPRLSPLGPWH